MKAEKSKYPSIIHGIPNLSLSAVNPVCVFNCSGHGEQSFTAGLSVCTEHATVIDRGQFGQWPGPAASHGMDGLGAIPM